MKSVGNTKTRALVEGQKLLQTLGYNGFSFQHLADAVGVKKPSLYDHFESKEDFGLQLLSKYQTMFTSWAETVSVFEPSAQVGAFFEIFIKFSSDKKLCPLCALSADVTSLPKEMKQGIEDLYDIRKAWLKNIIKIGQTKKQFRKDKTSEELANLVSAIGLGAHLGARVTGKIELIKEAKKQALEILEG